MAIDGEEQSGYEGGAMTRSPFRIERISPTVFFACGCTLVPRGDVDEVPRLLACPTHAAIIRGAIPPAPLPLRCAIHGTALVCPKCMGSRGGAARSAAKLAQLRAAARRPRPGKKRNASASAPEAPRAKGKTVIGKPD